MLIWSIYIEIWSKLSLLLLMYYLIFGSQNLKVEMYKEIVRQLTMLFIIRQLLLTAWFENTWLENIVNKKHIAEFKKLY